MRNTLVATTLLAICTVAYGQPTLTWPAGYPLEGELLWYDAAGNVQSHSFSVGSGIGSTTISVPGAHLRDGAIFPASQISGGVLINWQQQSRPQEPYKINVPDPLPGLANPLIKAPAPPAAGGGTWLLLFKLTPRSIAEANSKGISAPIELNAVIMSSARWRQGFIPNKYVEIQSDNTGAALANYTGVQFFDDESQVTEYRLMCGARPDIVEGTVLEAGLPVTTNYKVTYNSQRVRTTDIAGAPLWSQGNPSYTVNGVTIEFDVTYVEQP